MSDMTADGPNNRFQMDATKLRLPIMVVVGLLSAVAAGAGMWAAASVKLEAHAAALERLEERQEKTEHRTTRVEDVVSSVKDIVQEIRQDVKELKRR